MEFTEQRIQELKAQHGDVFMVSANDGKYSAIIKKPSRMHMSHATKVGKADPIKFNETLLRDIWIEGDMELQNNLDYFLEVSAQLDTLFEKVQVEIKKL